MTYRLLWLTRHLRARLAWSRPLTATSAIGIALGVLCAGAAAVRGAAVLPEGNLIDTATFNAAIGVFVATLVVLASGLHWTARGRAAWAGWLASLVLFAYAVETAQALRGLDPRFSAVAAPGDRLVGLVFFLSALGVMACFLVLAGKYMRAAPTPLVVAVRYGAAASLLAFGAGIYMSLVTQGRHVPDEGNLLLIHAAGFHGLQAVPIVALFFGWAGGPESTARPWVHAAGLAWLGLCLTVARQAAAGTAPFTPSPALALAGLLLAAWSVVFLAGLRVWLRAPLPVPPGNAHAPVAV